MSRDHARRFARFAGTILTVTLVTMLAARPATARVRKRVATHKPTAAPAPVQARVTNEAPAPADDDPDRERILHLQATLDDLVTRRPFSHVRLGMRVMDARTGRVFFGRRPKVLMDPASNQKVLATSAALLRLGADWRYRTELLGPEPDEDGVIRGDLVLRGSGDPTLRARDLAELADTLSRRGVVRVDGAVIGDPRRIGVDGPPSGRAALVVSGGSVFVRVRPGAPGAAAEVGVRLPAGSYILRNHATTAKTKPKGKARARVGVSVGITEGKLVIEVTGRLSPNGRTLMLHRPVPATFHAAVTLNAALLDVGIAVRDPARTGSAAPARVELLAVHESAPLPMVFRRLNKDSDNEYAERVLDTLGAEVFGGPPSAEKGVHALRDAMGELGLAAGTFQPANGSGLGHVNRISPDAMAALLRKLYLDPRIGADIMQSLSVGGVDGTTRNRFRGTVSSHRVRAKTGTLNGKSCLSGFVGDGGDVVIFSMMTEGVRSRGLTAVRQAQVGAVNAMMRYVREGAGPVQVVPGEGEPGGPDALPGGDLETGEGETDSEADGETDADGAGAGAGEDEPRASTTSTSDALDAILKKAHEPSASPGAPGAPADEPMPHREARPQPDRRQPAKAP